MSWLKNLSGILPLLTLLSLASCASIDIVDVPVFKELPNGRAYYVYTYSDREGEIRAGETFYDENFMREPLTFKQLKNESVLLPAFSYGEIAIFLIEVCEKYKKECRNRGNPQQRLKKLANEPYARTLNSR
ncbi:MAG: hypothetical protein BWZ03_00142 [bacterium ADurb.BinA186]|nr:MAG: hypothetical protein BWZ03_00142 [bacterium ADurb.BinA186]